MCLAGEAHAQPTPVTPPATPPVAAPTTPNPAPKVKWVPQVEVAGWWLGVAMDFLPIGSIDQNMMAIPGNFNTAPTVGFSGLIDYATSSNVSIGFAPRAIFGVKPENSFSPAKQFDLRLRVAVGGTSELALACTDSALLDTP